MWDLFVPVQRERAGRIGSYMSTRVSFHLMYSCFRQLADTAVSFHEKCLRCWPEVEHAPYAVFRSISLGPKRHTVNSMQYGSLPIWLKDSDRLSKLARCPEIFTYKHLLCHISTKSDLIICKLLQWTSEVTLGPKLRSCRKFPFWHGRHAWI